MIKKIVIAGCRDYTNYSQAKEYIDKRLNELAKQYGMKSYKSDI